MPSSLVLTKPEVGKPDSTEDVKIVNALTAIEAWANSLTSNGTGISEAELSAAVRALLNNKTAGGTTAKSMVAAEQSRTSAAYGTMTTPDEVTVVLPENGLIAVWYQATWKSSASQAGRAALFIGANQLKAVVPNNFGLTAKPVTQSAYGTTSGTWRPLSSFPGGLLSSATGSEYEGDATTGQVVGMVPAAGEAGSWGTFETEGGFVNNIATGAAGPVYIFAAAGTYKISVQFKSASGSVSVKNRKLWALVIA